MHLLIYFSFLFFLGLFAILPLKVLYAISDFLRFLFYRVIHYRRKIILQNMRNSFPEKSHKQLMELLYKFYGNLMDIVVEGLKGLTVSSKMIVERYKILNPELIDSYFEKGKSIICVAAHYCNWEWGAFSGGSQLKHKIIALYKPMSNSFIDQFVRKKRAKARITMASIYETTQTFEKYLTETCAFVMVADQSPANIEQAYWTTFLNQDTACLHGPEKHARSNNLPVLFLDIQRQNRGYYTVEASVIADNSNSLKDGELTEKYMKKLESIIREKPENWLWSHRRWKRSRTELNN